MPDGFAEPVDVQMSDLGGTRPALGDKMHFGMSGQNSPLEILPGPAVHEPFFADQDERGSRSIWARVWSKSRSAGVTPVSVGRLLRFAIGGALLLIGAFFTFDRFFALHTSDAMLSAAPMVLRARIDGVVSVNAMLLGGIVEAQSPIGSITDDRVDDSRLAELQGATRIAEEELAALHVRLGQLAAQAQETRGHVASFRNARTEQLAARLREADAAAASAQAKLRETAVTLRRTESLFATQTASGAALDLARSNQSAAQSDFNAAVHHQAAARAELAAATSGVFALDAATDRSISQQRYDQLQTRAGDLSSELATAQAKVDGLRNQLAIEQARVAHRAHVDLTLPVRARLVRIAAQDGELVSRGQEIATAVDCSQPMVTADVTEAVFRKLSVGMTGEFRTGNDGVRHPGRIVQMMSPLDETQPQHMGESAHHRIVMRLDPEGLAASCQVGRMGQLSF